MKYLCLFLNFLILIQYYSIAHGNTINSNNKQHIFSGKLILSKDSNKIKLLKKLLSESFKNKVKSCKQSDSSINKKILSAFSDNEEITKSQDATNAPFIKTITENQNLFGSLSTIFPEGVSNSSSSSNKSSDSTSTSGSTSSSNSSSSSSNNSSSSSGSSNTSDSSKNSKESSTNEKTYGYLSTKKPDVGTVSPNISEYDKLSLIKLVGLLKTTSVTDLKGTTASIMTIIREISNQVKQNGKEELSRQTLDQLQDIKKMISLGGISQEELLQNIEEAKRIEEEKQRLYLISIKKVKISTVHPSKVFDKTKPAPKNQESKISTSPTKKTNEVTAKKNDLSSISELDLEKLIESQISTMTRDLNKNKSDNKNDNKDKPEEDKNKASSKSEETNSGYKKVDTITTTNINQIDVQKFEDQLTSILFTNDKSKKQKQDVGTIKTDSKTAIEIHQKPKIVEVYVENSKDSLIKVIETNEDLIKKDVLQELAIKFINESSSQNSKTQATKTNLLPSSNSKINLGTDSNVPLVIEILSKILKPIDQSLKIPEIKSSLSTEEKKNLTDKIEKENKLKVDAINSFLYYIIKISNEAKIKSDKINNQTEKDKINNKKVELLNQEIENFTSIIDSVLNDSSKKISTDMKKDIKKLLDTNFTRLNELIERITSNMILQKVDEKLTFSIVESPTIVDENGGKKTLFDIIQNVVDDKNVKSDSQKILDNISSIKKIILDYTTFDQNNSNSKDDINKKLQENKQKIEENIEQAITKILNIMNNKSLTDKDKDEKIKEELDSFKKNYNTLIGNSKIESKDELENKSNDNKKSGILNDIKKELDTIIKTITTNSDKNKSKVSEDVINTSITEIINGEEKKINLSDLVKKSIKETTEKSDTEKIADKISKIKKMIEDYTSFDQKSSISEKDFNKKLEENKSKISENLELVINQILNIMSDKSLNETDKNLKIKEEVENYKKFYNKMVGNTEKDTKDDSEIKINEDKKIDILNQIKIEGDSIKKMANDNAIKVKSVVKQISTITRTEIDSVKEKLSDIVKKAVINNKTEITDTDNILSLVNKIEKMIQDYTIFDQKNSKTINEVNKIIQENDKKIGENLEQSIVKILNITTNKSISDKDKDQKIKEIIDDYKKFYNTLIGNSYSEVKDDTQNKANENKRIDLISEIKKEAVNISKFVKTNSENNKTKVSDEITSTIIIENLNGKENKETLSNLVKKSIELNSERTEAKKINSMVAQIMKLIDEYTKLDQTNSNSVQDIKKKIEENNKMISEKLEQAINKIIEIMSDKSISEKNKDTKIKFELDSYKKAFNDLIGNTDKENKEDYEINNNEQKKKDILKEIKDKANSINKIIVDSKEEEKVQKKVENKKISMTKETIDGVIKKESLFDIIAKAVDEKKKENNSTEKSKNSFVLDAINDFINLAEEYSSINQQRESSNKSNQDYTKLIINRIETLITEISKKNEMIADLKYNSLEEAEKSIEKKKLLKSDNRDLLDLYAIFFNQLVGNNKKEPKPDENLSKLIEKSKIEIQAKLEGLADKITKVFKVSKTESVLDNKEIDEIIKEVIESTKPKVKEVNINIKKYINGISSTEVKSQFGSNNVEKIIYIKDLKQVIKLTGKQFDMNLTENTPNIKYKEDISTYVVFLDNENKVKAVNVQTPIKLLSLFSADESGKNVVSKLVNTSNLLKNNSISTYKIDPKTGLISLLKQQVTTSLILAKKPIAILKIDSNNNVILAQGILSTYKYIAKEISLVSINETGGLVALKDISTTNKLKTSEIKILKYNPDSKQVYIQNVNTSNLYKISSILTYYPNKIASISSTNLLMKKEINTL